MFSCEIEENGLFGKNFIMWDKYIVLSLFMTHLKLHGIVSWCYHDMTLLQKIDIVRKVVIFCWLNLFCSQQIPVSHNRPHFVLEDMKIFVLRELAVSHSFELLWYNPAYHLIEDNNSNPYTQWTICNKSCHGIIFSCDFFIFQ